MMTCVSVRSARADVEVTAIFNTYMYNYYITSAALDTRN